jgi:HTH-type transcriptional regulator/antitoxin HipB
MKQFVYSPESLGHAIRRVRKLKQINQKEAGSSFMIEQSTVSSIEQGAHGTRIETLFRMFAALDLEMIIQSKNVHDLQFDEDFWE